MRVVVQRVTSAQVMANGRLAGTIGKGLLIFLGVGNEDTHADLSWLVNKVASLRIFEDADGLMNLSVVDQKADIMVISQFTLYGNLKKGTRPSFNRAAAPEPANTLYEAFKEQLSVRLLRPVASGVFGADMHIEAHHDGPVTLIIDTQQRDL